MHSIFTLALAIFSVSAFPRGVQKAKLNEVCEFSSDFNTCEKGLFCLKATVAGRVAGLFSSDPKHKPTCVKRIPLRQKCGKLPSGEKNSCGPNAVCSFSSGQKIGYCKETFAKNKQRCGVLPGYTEGDKITCENGLFCGKVGGSFQCVKNKHNDLHGAADPEDDDELPKGHNAGAGNAGADKAGAENAGADEAEGAPMDRFKAAPTSFKDAMGKLKIRSATPSESDVKTAYEEFEPLVRGDGNALKNLQYARNWWYINQFQKEATTEAEARKQLNLGPGENADARFKLWSKYIHPDKNPNALDAATEAFKFLQIAKDLCN